MIGTPRIVLEPAKCWQIDVCSGLTVVNGFKSFLNMIDLYTGFCIPVPLKKETSEEIAMSIENYLIKIFGPPSEISSDNTANLTGPPIRKLCSFNNNNNNHLLPLEKMVTMITEWLLHVNRVR